MLNSDSKGESILPKQWKSQSKYQKKKSNSDKKSEKFKGFKEPSEIYKADKDNTSLNHDSKVSKALFTV